MEFVDHSTVELIKHNASDEDVAYAAWVSNFGDEARDRDTSRIEGLINFLYREKHMSPFEHGSFTFFVDTPIFVAREFMRHRTWSYNEVSGRYAELKPRFYVPSNDRPKVQEGKVGAYTFTPGSEDQNKITQWATKRAYGLSWRMYRVMLRLGIAREVARNVLPVGIFTQFYATANPRNVMQFLTLRNDKHALYEIREVAKSIEEQFAVAMPLTYAAYVAERDGTTIHAMKRKGTLPKTFTSGGQMVTLDKNEYIVSINATSNVEEIARALKKMNDERGNA